MDDQVQNYPSTVQISISTRKVTASQLIRLVAPAFSAADFVLITDIDMIPLRSDYFQKIVLEASRERACFLVARDVLDSDQYPICYTVIKPDCLRAGLEKLGYLRDSIEESLFALLETSEPPFFDDSAVRGTNVWYSDQRLLRTIIDSCERDGVKVLRLNDSELKFRRLDRLYHFPFLRRVWKALDHQGFFVDYHVHHAANKRKKMIESLDENREFLRS